MGRHSKPDRIFGFALSTTYLTESPEWIAADPPPMEEDENNAAGVACDQLIRNTVRKAREVFPGAVHRYVQTKKGTRPCITLIEDKTQTATLPVTPSDDILKKLQEVMGLTNNARWYLRAE
ncbi:hypothetical protein BDP27DRAFT_1356897 [Rhodocollybia butyracea]|uniref:Uncharacterized protein n=1 Tax=Rhodocollybia butyracea TaxID=206335 RepID=A0A9P5Q9W3_9AGAR|nr:hypothetical protein BDP27DRAFT_1356897 [Rhodocollybia butyracea]